MDKRLRISEQVIEQWMFMPLFFVGFDAFSGLTNVDAFCNIFRALADHRPGFLVSFFPRNYLSILQSHLVPRLTELWVFSKILLVKEI